MKRVFLKSIIALAIFCTSCENFLTTEMESKIEFDGSLSSTEALLLVNGVYSSLATRSNWGIYDVNMNVLEVGSRSVTVESTLTSIEPLKEYDYTSSLYSIKSVYQNSYISIQQANAVIDYVPLINQAAEGLSSQLRDRYIAEARFIRALNYFNLVRYYGGVPLAIEVTDDVYDFNLARSSVEEVYNVIIADLEYAIEYLYNKPTASIQPRYSVSETGRATRAAAMGLLSKVYLTAASMKKLSGVDTARDDGYVPMALNSYEWVDLTRSYTLAADYAMQVISLSESGQIDVKLNDDYGTIFTLAGENSSESLFEVQFNEADEMGSRLGAFIGMINQAQYARRLSSGSDYIYEHNINYYYDDVNGYYLLDRGNTDQRVLWNNAFYMWDSDQTTVSAVTMHRNIMPYKYRMGMVLTSDSTPVNAVVLRYAEILLIYAEAINELGQPTLALQYVNKVRERSRKGINAASNLMEPFYYDSGYPEVNPVSLEPADYNTGLYDIDETRELIKLERRLELAYEGNSKIDEIRFGELIPNCKSSYEYAHADVAITKIGSHFLDYVKNSYPNGPETLKTTTLNPKATNVRYRHQFLPIPKAEMDKNPNLVNNPGW